MEGWFYRMCVTFITGTMKAGKSKRLIESIRKTYCQDITVFKPNCDERDGLKVKSRATPLYYEAEPFEVRRIEPVGNKDGFIFIDEFQFIDHEMLEQFIIINRHVSNITLAGLTHNYKGEEFKTTRLIREYGDTVTNLRIPCDRCNSKLANHNVLLLNGKRIVDGEVEKVFCDENYSYDVWCDSCISE